MKNYKALLLLIALLLVNLAVWLNNPAFARRDSWADQIDLLVDIRHELVTGYVEEPDEKKMIEAAVQGMVNSLNDPYTTYIAPKYLDMFYEQVEGSFTGIGAEIMIDQQLKRLKISSPLEDSPAWHAGVMAGDIVLEIEGQTTEDIVIMEAVRRLKGPKGTKVTIKVRHESGEEEMITITRDVINVPTVKGRRGPGPEGHWEFMIDPVRRIAHVRLTQFTQQTINDLRRVLTNLVDQDVRGLILDVRGNPGGLLDAAVEVADMFLEEGKTIVSVKGRGVPQKHHLAVRPPIVPEIPVVVLANKLSASASEIVTGALADNGRAKFIGTRTFGKGSVQQVKRLENNLGALKLTKAYYYIPSGKKIHQSPDSETWGVDPEEGFYVPMSHEQLKKMLEVLHKRDVLQKENHARGPEVLTPQWIEQNWADPQLAAALRAILGKLDSGRWPHVGLDDVKGLALQAKRDALIRRRNFFQDRVKQVEEELETLAGQMQQSLWADRGDDKPDAQASTDPGQPPDDEDAAVLEAPKLELAPAGR